MQFSRLYASKYMKLLALSTISASGSKYGWSFSIPYSFAIMSPVMKFKLVMTGNWGFVEKNISTRAISCVWQYFIDTKPGLILSPYCLMNCGRSSSLSMAGVNVGFCICGLVIWGIVLNWSNSGFCVLMFFYLLQFP